jgi:hypothetical protein
MSRTHRRRQDDDAFDSRGLLKDGHRYRVPTKLMDSANQRARITDATGGTAGLGRPGYRIPVSDSPLVALAAANRRQAAYDSYERALVNAWKAKDAAPDETESDDEGAICTVMNDDYPLYYGSPGHIRNGICVPDDLEDDIQDAKRRRKPDDDEEEEDIADPQSDRARTVDQQARDHKARMARIYADHDQQLREAWRRG